MGDAKTALLVSPAGEVYTKSPRTRRAWTEVLRANIADALATVGPGATIETFGRQFLITGVDSAAAAPCVADVFGIRWVREVRQLRAGSLAELVDLVERFAGGRVTGRTFGVRVRRRGDHDWRSGEAERAIGDRLLERSAGVDLDQPEVWVRVFVTGEIVHLEKRRWEGPGGLPLGTQAPALVLLSGGFDSPVAAWMLMRRGSPVDFLHVTLDCGQSDHAAVVARDLTSRWSTGRDPLLWLVEFRDLRAALMEQVSSRLRQVVLKQLMLAAGDRLAELEGHPALVTGESLGQVSSQTLTHLASVDAVTERVVLRPLIGLDKEEIVALSRRVGNAALSARAKEVCDLSTGPVATGAPRHAIDRARQRVPEGLLDEALAGRRVLALSEWAPGVEPVPVVSAVPAHMAVCAVGDVVPAEGPVAICGPVRDAVVIATRLGRAGREAVVVAPPDELAAVARIG